MIQCPLLTSTDIVQMWYRHTGKLNTQTHKINKIPHEAKLSISFREELKKTVRKLRPWRESYISQVTARNGQAHQAVHMA